MKKIWKENRVLFMLIIVLIICFIAICSVVLSYFVGTHKSIYGDRLENQILVDSGTKKEYLNTIKEESLIKNADFRVGIRTIYIELEFNENATLVEAESKALESLKNIDEEILKYYDINFILKKDKTEKDEGFIIMGAKNSNGTGISWNNNTVTEKVEK